MATPWQLFDRFSGAMIVQSLEVADGFWSRLVGLQFRSGLPTGHGLLLVPCSSIHTFMMRFPLDVVMLSRRGQILAVRHGVRPWRILLPVRHTFAILEMPAGTASVKPGDFMELRSANAGQIPGSLAFMAANVNAR